jgi:hypothetical protein
VYRGGRRRNIWRSSPTPWYRPSEVQFALNLDPGVPVIMCDARRRDSARDALIALVEHAMKSAWGQQEEPAPVG